MEYRKGMILFYRKSNDAILLLMDFDKQKQEWEVYYWWTDNTNDPGYWSFEETELNKFYKPISAFGTDR